MGIKKIRKSGPQSGMTLIELLIALAILAVGLGALNLLFITAMYTNNRNKQDTRATMLAQLVLEKLIAEPAYDSANITLTDCAGTVWTLATVGAANPGAGANLDTSSGSLSYGNIDFGQTYSSITTNYKMDYVECGANGNQTTHEIRWNVMTLNKNLRMVTVASRQYGGVRKGAAFTLPVSLRSIGGH